MISVVMPCYRPNFQLLYKAIESLSTQTYDNFELIICGDHNTKDEKESINKVIDSFKKLKISYIENMEIPGISYTRNKAAEKAKGEWLVWLDCDDTLENDCLEKLHTCALKQNVNYVIGQCNVISKHMVRKKNSNDFFELYKRYRASIYDPFMLNVTAIQPQLIKRSVFLDMGGFSVDYIKAELTEFLLRYLSLYPSRTISFSCNAEYNYNKDALDSVSKGRKELFAYRRRALLEYAMRNKVKIDDIVYLGRDIKKDIPLYVPIKNGVLIYRIPYRNNTEVSFEEVHDLVGNGEKLDVHSSYK